MFSRADQMGMAVVVSARLGHLQALVSFPCDVDGEVVFTEKLRGYIQRRLCLAAIQRSDCFPLLCRVSDRMDESDLHLCIDRRHFQLLRWLLYPLVSQQKMGKIRLKMLKKTPASSHAGVLKVGGMGIQRLALFGTADMPMPSLCIRLNRLSFIFANDEILDV